MSNDPTDLETAVGLLTDGAYARRKRQLLMKTSDEITLEIVFEVLCALHQMATKKQIEQVLERVHD